MADLVPAEDIERIVGANRRDFHHLGRAVSDQQTVYILHSRYCLDHQPDLRQCRYSLALDNGIQLDHWTGFEDLPVVLEVYENRIVPLVRVTDPWAAT